MSTAAKLVKADDWKYLYSEALRSMTSPDFSARLSESEKAIIRRMGQLDGGSRESAEWLAITEALKSLYTLRRERLMSWFGPFNAQQ